jgi:hypothetical protein
MDVRFFNSLNKNLHEPADKFVSALGRQTCFVKYNINLSDRSAPGRQTCFVKYNINLSARSAPGQQTCRLAHVRFCLKNWANGMYIRQPYKSELRWGAALVKRKSDEKIKSKPKRF